MANGLLLAAAEAEGFDLLLTSDKNIAYQQNMSNRVIAIVVLGNPNWKVARLHTEKILASVEATTPGSYVEVEIPFQ